MSSKIMYRCLVLNLIKLVPKKISIHCCICNMLFTRVIHYSVLYSLMYNKDIYLDKCSGSVFTNLFRIRI